jgi:hypothetical protein
MNWQPMKTAPWGKPVLVWDGGAIFVAVRYRESECVSSSDGWCEADTNGDYIPSRKLIQLTHWMPLPNPPSG